MVEAKSILGTNPAWAQEVRKRIELHSPDLASSTFVLVTPDRIYVWPQGAPLDAAPLALDTLRLLGDHIRRAGAVAGCTVEADVWKDIVHWWLQDLATGVATPPSDVGFDAIARALRDGRLISEVAA